MPFKTKPQFFKRPLPFFSLKVCLYKVISIHLGNHLALSLLLIILAWTVNKIQHIPSIFLNKTINFTTETNISFFARNFFSNHLFNKCKMKTSKLKLISFPQKAKHIKRRISNHSAQSDNLRTY